jgi:hypothetical protein
VRKGEKLFIVTFLSSEGEVVVFTGVSVGSAVVDVVSTGGSNR